MAVANRSRCIFCKIIDGIEKSEMIFQNDNICVFRDIKPATKNHILAVPREHFKDCKFLPSEQKPLVQEMMTAAQEALRTLGDDLSDVRYGFHWPPFHSVAHLHLHAISPVSEMGFISRMIFKPDSFWFVSPEYVLSRL